MVQLKWLSVDQPGCLFLEIGMHEMHERSHSNTKVSPAG